VDADGSNRLQQEIDALKAATDLPTLIGATLELRRRGRLYVACCPFHAEKTPSFNVWRDHYHCFGCHEHGDVFDWLRSQHRMEMPEAVRHLGGGNGTPSPDADIVAMRAKRKAESDAKVAATRREQIGEATRWWRKTVPVAGTVAERYLIETRGIPRPDGGWPDCVRFLRGDDTRALIVGVTTDDGTLCAVQRIYLDLDAQNIRWEDAKRSKVKLTAGTFAAVEGSAGVVRLPGLADGPLSICEGVETGLSVWSATGHETWVTLGSISNATPPHGRRAVIGRDDDAPHSAADKALTKALGRWREAKLDVVVATPWADRRGDRSDFNDTLCEHGAAAVCARIQAALDRGPPPPKRLPIETGRAVVHETVRQFFAEALAWGNDPVSTALSAPVHLVQLDMGGGKSRQARSEAVQTILGMRSRGDKRNIAIAVPTHTLGAEQARLFEELPAVQAAGLQVRIWRGREADNPDAPGHAMCRNPDLVREILALKLDVKKRACKVCPHRAACAYLRQEKLRGQLWLVAHQLLYERKPRALGKLAAVIVDENPIGASLWGHDRSIALPLDVLDRVDLIQGQDGGLATDRLLYLRRLALDTMRALPDRPLPRDAFQAAGFTVSNTKEAHGLEWRTRMDVELKLGMTKAEQHEALAAARLNADLSRRAAMWRAVQALLSPDGPTESGWAALGIETDKHGKTTRVITLKHRKSVKKGWQVPTLLLDATARIELLRYIWPSVQQTADVRLHAPHQSIIQIRDNAFALSRLDVEGARDNTERRHRERNMREVHAIICREARYYAPGRVLVVVQLRIVEALLDIGNLPGNIELAHHNGIRGRDGWGDVCSLMVIGRTMPPSSTIARMTEALTGTAMPERGYNRAPAWRELAHGTPEACEAWAYPDPIGEALRWQACEAEVVQIIGRARGVNRTASNPVEVLVLTDLPLPLPVEPIQMSALELSLADRMLAAGGVVLENAGDAAAAYPELSKSRDAAKKRFARARLGTNPYKKSTAYTGLSPTSHAGNDQEGGARTVLVQVDYRRTGSGRSAASAWFDPGIVPEGLILRWLTERVGPLSWHEVQRPGRIGILIA
jgi:putative DNA primase/helicase